MLFLFVCFVFILEKTINTVHNASFLGAVLGFFFKSKKNNFVFNGDLF